MEEEEEDFRREIILFLFFFVYNREEVGGFMKKMSSRHNQILEILIEHGQIEVIKLSDVFNVSQVTIRKDLDDLEDYDEEQQILIKELYNSPQFKQAKELFEEYVEKRKPLLLQLIEVLNEDRWEGYLPLSGRTTAQG